MEYKIKVSSLWRLTSERDDE